MRNRLVLLLKSVCALGFIGALYYVTRTIVDVKEVHAMTDNRKSVCVGRVLIDVPNEVKVRLRRAVISGWMVQSMAESHEEFSSNLNAKEQELSARTNERGHRSLEVNREIRTEHVTGKIFSYDREWVHGFEGDKRIDSTFTKSLAYIHGEGTSYVFSSDFAGDRSAELLQLVRQLRLRQQDEIPTQTGFCIEKGIIGGELRAEQTESVVAFMTFPNHPDFGVALDSAAGRRQTSTLFSRADSFDFDFGMRKITLRRQERTVDVFTGQELAEKFLELDGKSRHIFQWESYGDQSTTKRPQLSMELTTGISPRPGGKPVDASLSDLALLKLWDTMVGSIRLRPVHAQKP